MPFVLKKISDHGTTNPIVARLSLQALQLLRQSAASKDVRDKIGKLYVESLQPKLLRCGEISERYCQEFNSAASAYKPPPAGATSIEVPQILRLGRVPQLPNTQRPSLASKTPKHSFSKEQRPASRC